MDNGNASLHSLWTLSILGVVLLLMTGCSSLPKAAPTSTKPVCKALIGPIRYNDQNINSRRHAGPDLAPDLKARNQVGVGLKCPAYR